MACRLPRARRRGELDLRRRWISAAAEIRDVRGWKRRGSRFARCDCSARSSHRSGRSTGSTVSARLVRAGVSSGTRSSTGFDARGPGARQVASALEQTRLDARSALLELSVLLGRAEDSLAVREADPNGGRAPTEADSVRLIQLVERLPEVGLARTLAARSELDAIDAAHAKSPAVSFTVDAGLAGADLTHLVPPNLLEENRMRRSRTGWRATLGASAAVHAAAGDRRDREAEHTRSRGAAQRAEKYAARQRRRACARRRLTLLARWRVAYRTVEAARRTERARGGEPAPRQESLQRGRNAAARSARRPARVRRVATAPRRCASGESVAPVRGGGPPMSAFSARYAPLAAIVVAMRRQCAAARPTTPRPAEDRGARAGRTAHLTLVRRHRDGHRAVARRQRDRRVDAVRGDGREPRAAQCRRSRHAGRRPSACW